MSATLLTIKLSIPSAGKYLVDRPFLVMKLHECLNPVCRLALISTGRHAFIGHGR